MELEHSLFARARRGEEIPEPCRDGRVGASYARYTGEELTLGDRPYVDDLELPEMLHGAVVLSPHARARVLSIDTSKAAAVAGVEAVATAEDVPGARRVGLIVQDWPVFVAAGETTKTVTVAVNDDAAFRQLADAARKAIA